MSSTAKPVICRHCGLPIEGENPLYLTQTNLPSPKPIHALCLEKVQSRPRHYSASLDEAARNKLFAKNRQFRGGRSQRGSDKAYHGDTWD